ncbi:glutathione S-transferase N-terminal domain-containing protein [Alphaproteobacteria bacterium]|nr:glutathione S-transferase N-terminal domain-containing protein [Alphaproteobacteria bacterium]
MINLYGRRNSINVQKVSWALCELNLDFIWHDEHGKFGTVNVENYENLNPQLIVPTLDHKGSIIKQSNAIVRYLYRKYTDVYETSKDEDIAIAESWMEFQTTDLQLNMTPVFWGLVRNPPEDRDQELIDKNIILLNKKFEISF